MNYPRNMRGYGERTPNPKWPNEASIAVQFVINYEEGGESCILHGDEESEKFLSEIIDAKAWPNQRHMNMESIYEYGSRSGFWRLYRIFTESNIPVTVYGVATALARSPEQVNAMKNANWEIASHGLKWLDYKDKNKELEKKDLEEAISIHTAVTGSPPRGWYLGRCSENTLDLVTENGSFDYISDSYNDDLPYWINLNGGDQLVIPYTLDINDMRFATKQGFNSGTQFFDYLKDSFDILIEEGRAGFPKMMNIGLHCRLAGRPGRAMAVKRFIRYLKTHNDVWLAKRIEIAEHWKTKHPRTREKLIPSQMSKSQFVELFGNIFENTPVIARKAFESELSNSTDTILGLNAALCFQFRKLSPNEKLKILVSHPDLAGNQLEKKLLTDESEKEQYSAGLDVLSKSEKDRFENLNKAYTLKFKHPFILAVTGLTKYEILKSFEARLENNSSVEFQTACNEVEKIALIRVKEIFKNSKKSSN